MFVIHLSDQKEWMVSIFHVNHQFLQKIELIIKFIDLNSISEHLFWWFQAFTLVITDHTCLSHHDELQSIPILNTLMILTKFDHWFCYTVLGSVPLFSNLLDQQRSIVPVLYKFVFLSLTNWHQRSTQSCYTLHLLLKVKNIKIHSFGNFFKKNIMFGDFRRVFC